MREIMNKLNSIESGNAGIKEKLNNMSVEQKKLMMENQMLKMKNYKIRQTIKKEED